MYGTQGKDVARTTAISKRSKILSVSHSSESRGRNESATSITRTGALVIAKSHTRTVIKSRTNTYSTPKTKWPCARVSINTGGLAR